MGKRVTLVVGVVAAVGIVSALMIAGYTGTPESADSLSGDVVTDTLETAGALPEDAGAVTETPSPKRMTGSISNLENAAAIDKYAFIFFYSDDSEQTQSKRSVFRRAMSNITEKAVPLEIDTTDPTESQIVSKFGVSRAPMPLVLAVAPNGAITGGFPQEFEEGQLLGAFASSCEEKTLKALQERRVVVVCVQNGNTKLNDDAMKGVQDLKADPNFGAFTEIVTLDPVDPSESDFLKALQVAPQTDTAVTVCLVPPGRAIARFTGGTKKETIVAALSSKAGCGPAGCGPSGCGK
jgi:hypothetical protein